MADHAQYVRLDGEAVTLVFALVKDAWAELVYCGAPLPEGEDPAMLAASARRGRHESQPDRPPVPGILPERKGGWSGTPAIEVSRGGMRLDTDFRLVDWRSDPRTISLRFADPALGLDLHSNWEVGEGALIKTGCVLINASSEPVAVDRLASLAFPIPARFADMITFSGRWAGEMREAQRPVFPDGFATSSSIGKQGFGGGNWSILCDPASGETIGAHLEWSGDYDTRIECDPAGAGDGRAMLHMAARWDTGEIVIAPGESFETPGAMIVLGASRTAMMQGFHRAVRTSIRLGPENGPRMVHLNSWEALGFGLSEEKLRALVSDAAALGVERFVLDDGWFGGRRNDRTSLGDWHVSPDVLPNGLDPLIEHVHSLGLDFGLWVEPEMVSPESDLYRAHPDWCIHIEGRERGTMRGQLVLDLTREQVRTYLFDRISDLLRAHAIAYLKWDHNRDLFPLAGRGHRQAEALYGLLSDLNDAFPHVEIESCSSGGGRIDTRILSYTHRVWPSDNNDPSERVRIMRSWSQFLPLEVLGNHVGPSPNPITGRRTEMDFRAKVALFGHMGVEADPGAMSETERGVLAAHIALYKEWRGVLHSGALHHLGHPDPAIFAQMVVGDDTALAVAAQTQFSPVFDAAPLRLAGLDAQASYRVRLLRPWPGKASLYLADWQGWENGLILSGRALMTQGLALPLTHPETAWLIALERL